MIRRTIPFLLAVAAYLAVYYGWPAAHAWFGPMVHAPERRYFLADLAGGIAIAALSVIFGRVLPRRLGGWR